MNGTTQSRFLIHHTDLNPIRHAAIESQRRLLRDSPPGIDARLSGLSDQGKRRIKWQQADIDLIKKAREDGASFHEICAHFPGRSAQSVHMAFLRLVDAPARPKHSWSQEETRYLTELALQGADVDEIAEALERPPISVRNKAKGIGVQLLPKRKEPKFSTEESERLQQMRVDGATYREIAAALGRPLSNVANHWYRLGSNRSRNKSNNSREYYPPTQLSLHDFQTIRSLRDQAASWSSIGSLFPQYRLDSIKQDFWRFTKRKLSATDMRTIQNLRRDGKTWTAIANTDEYVMKTGNGLSVAYYRTLKAKAEE
jgi:DNA-binding NarL/FixJ family response regulator